MGFEGLPFVLGWELTLACNLRCAHCGSKAGKPRPAELSTDECLAICDQLPELVVQEVNFTGGEPLLRSDIFELMARLNQLEIMTKVVTNGLLLTPAVIRRLSEVQVAGVGVSIDGCPATHDRIRGLDGMQHRLIRAIEALHEAGISTTVITTANSLNIGELPELRATLAGLGVKRWQVQPVFPLGRTRESTMLSLHEPDYLRLGDFARQCMAMDLYQGMQVLFGDSYGYYTEMDTRQPPWGGCPAGMVSCGITSDGKIKGCLSLPDKFIEGDLRQSDLWNIWFHPDAFPYTRAFDKSQLGENCRGCQEAERCRGGCSAMSFGSTGVMHNDPLCFAGMENRSQALNRQTKASGAKKSATM